MPGKPKDPAQEHLDRMLDLALTETFPASDPVSVKCDVETPPSAGTSGRAARAQGEGDSGRS